jgi:hypothetical protein
MGSISDEVSGFFNWPAMAQVMTQPLTGMNTRNYPWSKGRPEWKTDNLTAIRDPGHFKLYGPPRPVTRVALTFLTFMGKKG